MNEFAFIEKLKKKIPLSKRAMLGIGDDAAVLKKLGPGNLVVSTDMLVENVDFVLDELSPENIGRKALAVNLSDLAAMGAEPVAFVLSIGKPKHISTQWLERFYDGLLKLAKRCKVDCIGGDFSGAREFSVSVTILGLAERPVPRSGAEPGDWIGVTGSLGGSILRHHYAFEPRVREGLFLGKSRLVHSMIDISDGLYQDLQHILYASSVAAEVDLERIPVSKDAKRMAFRDRSKNSKQTCPLDPALERALTEGEDFELLFTVPQWAKAKIKKLWRRKFPKIPLTWIGRVVKGKPEVQWRSGGKKVRLGHLSQKGYKHF